LENCSTFTFSCLSIDNRRAGFKESFGIKDFEAQFIHIRIFGGGAGISFKEAMV